MAVTDKAPCCETCHEPMQVTTNADFDGNLSFRYECPRGCGLCAVCMLPLIGGSDDGGCSDCIAARARGPGGFCSCLAPLVAKGTPPMYVCKVGCAICPRCSQAVPFGEGCTGCYPPPSPSFDGTDALDGDIPF